MPHWFDRLLGRETKTSASLALLALPSGVSGARDIPSLVREGYERNAIAHRCIRLIAEASAAISLDTSHAQVQALLDSPEGSRSGAEFREALFGYLMIAGNAYAELRVLDGEPRALELMRPDRMRLRPGKPGQGVIHEYSVGGERRTFLRDPVSGRSPVFHLRLFNPADDLYGLSPLTAAGSALDLHNAGGRWARALLENSARPSGALVVSGEEGRLSEDQFSRLKAQLSENYAGSGNAGRPLLLEGGLDWKPMALSPADMDFTGARREAAREIALALGVPPLLLGLPGDNTYANYKEANRAFQVQTVQPLVRKTAAALGVWLAPWFGTSLSITPRFEEIDA